MNVLEFINWKNCMFENCKEEKDFYLMALVPMVSFIFWTKEERKTYAKNINEIMNDEHKKECLFAC